MTDKRFTITKDFFEHYYQIRDNGKILMGCFVKPQAETIVDLLNELHEKNQELKQFKEQVFDLIDAKIKHYRHKPFSAPVIQPLSINFDHDTDRLARLSELQQLKELLE